ncbi:MAG: SGNH/GDSL hydrolase family protein [Lentisphaerae bacterium]|nr:SGNH/GDSL hydrolase family protein [Lentisphaerota bacterium]
MKKVILIGDSIRAGYQEMVRTQLKGWADVCVPEHSGGSSKDILACLDASVISRHPDVLHINSGLHDLKKEFGQDAAAVPLNAYAENVRAIVSRVKSETEATVIWALTTPVNQEWHHKTKPFDRFEADVAAYNAAAARIARELGIYVNDLYAPILSAGRDDLLLPDGVHFKPEGYALLGRTVAGFIRKVSEAAEPGVARDA